MLHAHAAPLSALRKKRNLKEVLQLENVLGAVEARVWSDKNRLGNRLGMGQIGSAHRWEVFAISLDSYQHFHMDDPWWTSELGDSENQAEPETEKTKTHRD